MNRTPPTRSSRGAAETRRTRAEGFGASGGFTLAEVLAAMVFLAIVIPVAVEGLRIASRAGVVSQRKAIAARVADRMLNEWMVTGAALTASPRGTVEEDGQIFDWSLRSEVWTDATMRLVTVEVFYEVQGQEFDLRLCTLAGSD
jgi:type II secretory pathway pseudopilin PulG